MKINHQSWGVAFAACTLFLATAQGAKAEPPKAAQQLAYESAFDDYKPYRDAPLANWRELNDTVGSAPGAPGAASGHTEDSMGGMKGMEMPTAASALANAPNPMKRVPMHDGQHKKGSKP